MCTCVRVPCHFSHVRLFATLWTVAHQAPLFMGFSRQEYWSGLLCPPPRDFPNPGIEPGSLMSPALPEGFFTTSAIREALSLCKFYLFFPAGLSLKVYVKERIHFRVFKEMGACMPLDCPHIGPHILSHIGPLSVM